METSRNQAIIQSLVDMADNLVENFDVVELLTSLTDKCVNLLGAAAAGVMIASPPGELHLMASSSDAMKVVELFELQSDEGPCLDAFRTGQRVESEQLEAGEGRWPRFAIVAREAGFSSVLALPLRLRDSTIGALNLFNSGGSTMDAGDVLVAQGLADLATISILQHGTANEAQLVNEQLTHALASRVVIEQAKGVISERVGIELTEAFNRLRTYARSHSLKLSEVAQATVDGTLEPGTWATPFPTR